MMRVATYFFWFLVVSTTAVFAQDSSVIKETVYQVGSIKISGNKKTKPSIILREIPFRTGEEYPIKVLTEKFEDARRQLMNTALFHSVVVAADGFEGNKIHISVILKERWYLFPAPYLKPVDRNLNQWLIQQKASLDRVEYGIKLYYYNATGRNDKLKFLLINGYTKQFSYSYDRPYIDNKLKWGLRTGLATGQNREINYNTIADKQVFYKDENAFVGKFLNTYAELTYRRAIRTRHSFGFSYSTRKIADTIVSLNPAYLGNATKKITIPSLYYLMSYYDLDYNPYPTKGYAAEINFSKRGFSKAFNVWDLNLKGFGSWHLLPKTFISVSAYAGVKLPFKQPYVNQRFFGYGDTFLQGYEYYVTDGVAGGFVKTSINRELFNFKVRVPAIKRGKEATHIPFRIISKVYGNAGYAYNPQPGDNFLTNKMLYSGGVGIDIVTFYDIIFKLEWSFNQLGENGLFLHRKSIF